MHETIVNKLRKLENRYDIKILMAVESGSRAWGHHNEDSDYDIRFIYKNNDINRYLTINPESDVIESNDGLYDLVGWDIKKALKLHYKSNPNLREWILSPIRYVDDDYGIFDNLPNFNCTTLKHHYKGLAIRHYKKYLKNKSSYDFKFLKKLLYTIRCILAWNVLDDNILPSMNLDNLLQESRIDASLAEHITDARSAYSKLNKYIISTAEIEYLLNWVEDSLDVMQQDKSKSVNDKDITIYDKRFQKILRQIT